MINWYILASIGFVIVSILSYKIIHKIRSNRRGMFFKNSDILKNEDYNVFPFSEHKAQYYKILEIYDINGMAKVEYIGKSTNNGPRTGFISINTLSKCCRLANNKPPEVKSDEDTFV